MISLKEYAKEKGVSYEAIRKQVKKYINELEGHIIKIDRIQYLDDEAVSFLDSRRLKKSVISMELYKDDEIQRWIIENKSLLSRITELQDNLLKEKELVKILQKKNIDILNINQNLESELCKYRTLKKQFILKNKLNIILGSIIIFFSIIVLVIFLFSIGKDSIVTYEDYIVAGLEAFLIINNLQFIFYGSLGVIIITTIIMLYNIIFKKQNKK